MKTERIKEILQYAGFISALVAVTNLAWNIQAIRKSSEREMVQQWQKVIVFEILEKSSDSGVTFEEIRTKYRDAATDFNEFDVPKRELQSPSLRRILMELQTQGLASVLHDNKFALKRAPRVNEDLFLGPMLRMRPVGDKVITIARLEPGKYRIEELEAKLKLEFPEAGSIEEIRSLLSEMLQFGPIALNEDGKLIFSIRGRGPEP